MGLEHDELVQRSFEQAEKALEELEVPVGCVFYHTGLEKIVAEGRNSVNATKNATRHAEINCIDQICTNYQSNPSEDFWSQCEVYVTCEPCVMCTRLLRSIQVKKVYYGCSNPRFGGCQSVLKVASMDQIKERQLEFVPGIREQEAIGLFKKFYRLENQNAPEEMRKVKNRPKEKEAASCSKSASSLGDLNTQADSKQVKKQKFDLEENSEFR